MSPSPADSSASAWARALHVARTRIGPQGAARALGAILAVAFALYALAPYQTVRSLRAALRERDAARVVRALDLEGVRRSIHTQVNERLAATARSGPRPGTAKAVIGRMGPDVAQIFAAPVIDALLTPRGIDATLADDGQTAADLVHRLRGSPPGTPSPEPGAADTWLEDLRSQGFVSPLRFQIALASGWTLELHPSGLLRWRVVEVELPQDLLERRSR